MNLPNITSKQLDVLKFVADYLRRFACSPLLREIQTGCDIPSYKSVVDRLNALERKGYLHRQANKHRGIALSEAGAAWMVERENGQAVAAETAAREVEVAA